MNYNERIHLALHHEVENVAALAYSSSTKLEEQLQRVRNQIEIAARNKQTDALQLLQIWEGQITDARMLKAELQPGELEIADLNMTLPEIEAYEMIEQRSELLRQKLLKQTLTGAERK